MLLRKVSFRKSLGKKGSHQKKVLYYNCPIAYHLKIFSRSAHVAQAVEHFLGKEVVTGSIPVVG